jgi:geranylgeranyl diphosphate synthase, type I
VADPLSSAAALGADAALGRYRAWLGDGLRRGVKRARGDAPANPTVAAALDAFYGQMEYHLGWRHPDLSRARAHPGKLLRPALLLLSCELAAGRNGADAAERARLARQAVPAAVCVELVHNFSLVHDDIEDGDEERRHRPTLWKLWGVPQAINTGDAIFALARSGLWQLADEGIPAVVVVRLAALLDRVCLELCEGQHLDMVFEGRRDVTVAMYLDMIGRKTAALMACATEMGARLGAPADDKAAGHLERFGRALGLAFQLRDDLLGIWAPEELGKSHAGDLRRKKMTLPVLHALETSGGADRRALLDLYESTGEPADAQIVTALETLERSRARERVRQALAAEAALAREALDAAAGESVAAREAHDVLAALLGLLASAAD